PDVEWGLGCREELINDAKDLLHDSILKHLILAFQELGIEMSIGGPAEDALGSIDSSNKGQFRLDSQEAGNMIFTDLIEPHYQSSGVCGLASLWLRGQGKAEVNTVIAKALLGLPSYKFVPLLPQLTAHLTPFIFSILLYENHGSRMSGQVILGQCSMLKQKTKKMTEKEAETYDSVWNFHSSYICHELSHHFIHLFEQCSHHHRIHMNHYTLLSITLFLLWMISNDEIDISPDPNHVWALDVFRDHVKKDVKFDFHLPALGWLGGIQESCQIQKGVTESDGDVNPYDFESKRDLPSKIQCIMRLNDTIHKQVGFSVRQKTAMEMKSYGHDAPNLETALVVLPGDAQQWNQDILGQAGHLMPRSLFGPAVQPRDIHTTIPKPASLLRIAIDD
ncbi:unnamed protein product, partial [Darwinula stevensoni]